MLFGLSHRPERLKDAIQCAKAMKTRYMGTRSLPMYHLADVSFGMLFPRTSGRLFRMNADW
jgi:hypothetical protein